MVTELRDYRIREGRLDAFVEARHHRLLPVE